MYVYIYSIPVLTYISLLIIPCMIVYVTNNKEPWYTVGMESIQTPLNFSLFVILQPFAKIILVHFFSSLMYTQHPILTEKHRIVDIFADLLKKKNWNITWS